MPGKKKTKQAFPHNLFLIESAARLPLPSPPVRISQLFFSLLFGGNIHLFVHERGAIHHC